MSTPHDPSLPPPLFELPPEEPRTYTWFYVHAKVPGQPQRPPYGTHLDWEPALKTARAILSEMRAGTRVWIDEVVIDARSHTALKSIRRYTGEN